MLPLTTLTNLVTPLTSAQIRATMVASLVATGIPANLWRSGGVASTILTVAATVLAMTSQLVATMVSGFFLPLATGTGLQLLAYYVYGITAPAATYASGTLILTNAGGGIYTQGVGTYIAQGSNGITYTNTAAFTLGASTSISIPVAAQTLGTVGNANPGTVTAQITSLLGVTVTNPATIVGQNAISDAALRTLCLDSLAAQSVYGPRDAYEYAIQIATNAVTGAPVNVNRQTVSNASSTGVVTIYVASPSGVPDANDLTGISTSIEKIARPSGIVVNLLPVSTLPYSNSLTLWCAVPTGADSNLLLNTAQTGLTNFFSVYPISGYTFNDDAHPSGFTGLSADAIKAAISEAVGSNIPGVTVISILGATDLALSPGIVATDDVTLSLRTVPQPGQG